MPSRPTAHFRSLGLSLLALATLVLIYAQAQSCGEIEPISVRMRCHAIPVALSQLYHGRAHDYTGYQSLAMEFQTDRPLSELLEKYSQPGIPVEGTYFWAADDRGLSDGVYLAWVLFGTNVASFGKLYMLILLASSLFFIAGFWNDLLSLTTLVLTLCGIAVIIPVLAIATKVTGPNGGHWCEPFGLSESRVFDMLSFVAFLHFLLIPLRRRTGGVIATIALALQVVLFVLIYHARSSLGWQVLAVALVTCVFAWRAIRVLPSLRMMPGRAAGLALPLVFLMLGLVGLSVYKKQTYHPRYFTDQGARTFWHNALMGIYHPALAAEYHIGIDDRKSIELVMKYMKDRNDPRLTPDWEVDNALCSLGGHTQFDWTTYEIVAREVYWSIWKKHPWWALMNYVYTKPGTIGSEIIQVSFPSTAGHMEHRADAYRYNPFRPWPLLILLTALLLCGYQSFRGNMRRYLAMFLLIIPCSLIPAVAFYPWITTLAGFLLILTLGSYLSTAVLIFRVYRLLLQHWPVRADSRAEPAASRAAA